MIKKKNLINPATTIVYYTSIRTKINLVKIGTWSLVVNFIVFYYRYKNEYQKMAL